MADARVPADVRLPSPGLRRPPSADRAGPATRCRPGSAERGGRGSGASRSGGASSAAQSGHAVQSSQSASSQEDAASGAGGQAPVPASKLRVVCRLRPMSEQERHAGAVPALTASTERREVVAVRGQTRHVFHFDHVLSSFSAQLDVFAATLKPLVKDVLGGYEAAVFAYGQTGTGKTYTMEGDMDSTERRGLVPRAAEALIRALAQGPYFQHSVVASCLEIYNEELIDLLAPVPPQGPAAALAAANGAPGATPVRLDLKETGRGVRCVGLSEIPVDTVGEIQDLVRSAQERRRVAETRINARSSRSHCLFTLKVCCSEHVEDGELEARGKLHLVDLAGSECARNGTGYASQQDCMKGERERRNINKSLLTLGRVIAALREESSRVPYRDSKLTRLLQEALGGGCRTVMIATISPSQSAVDETISTLQYADQAAGIVNKPVAPMLTRSDSASLTPGGGACGVPSSVHGDCRADTRELELRVEYLAQEVEEAHVAFEQKRREAQELHQQVEATETKYLGAVGELKEAQRQLAERGYVLARTTAFADERVQDVERLTGALDAARQRCKNLASQLSDREADAVAVRAQARAVCDAGARSVGELTGVAREAQRQATAQAEACDSAHREAVSGLHDAAARQATALEDVTATARGVEAKVQARLAASLRGSAEEPAQSNAGADNSASMAALQDVTQAFMKEAEDHRAAVRQAASEVTAAAEAASLRRERLAAALEDMGAARAAGAAGRAPALARSLEELAAQLPARVNAAAGALSRTGARLEELKAEIPRAAAAADGSAREALVSADARLTKAWSEAADQLVQLREIVVDAASRLRNESAATATEQLLSQATAAFDGRLARELGALAASREAIAAEVRDLRQQAAVGEETVAALSRQREVLAAEVQRLQTSVASLATGADAATAEMASLQEAQRQRRDQALGAILRGVEELVGSELRLLGEDFVTSAEPARARLGDLSAGAQGLQSGLASLGSEAAQSALETSNAVQSLSSSLRGACDKVEKAQLGAAEAARATEAAVAATREDLEGVAAKVRSWGDAVEGVAGSLDEAAGAAAALEAMHEAPRRHWAAAQEAVAAALGDLRDHVAGPARGGLEAAAGHSEVVSQELAAVVEAFSGHRESVGDVLTQLSSDEELTNGQLSGLLALARDQGSLGEQEAARCGAAAAAAAEGAEALAAGAQRSAACGLEGWRAAFGVAQEVSDASLRAAAVAEETAAVRTFAASAADRAVAAHRAYGVANGAVGNHLDRLSATAAAVWRDGLAAPPLAAFREEKCAGETEDAGKENSAPEGVYALSAKGKQLDEDDIVAFKAPEPEALRRPTEESLLAEFRQNGGKPVMPSPAAPVAVAAAAAAAAPAAPEKVQAAAGPLTVSKQQRVPGGSTATFRPASRGALREVQAAGR
eukprot:TRINITY_DN3025_c0_g1_i2.p1 TRINITY_DN3025_c0_g1~~TRINITY_DN3025_c0_g1_i2.p1  ORF type:complete len:1414 (-),score=387.23 TRINITY_DN3025_c0_g1_i2:89-4330(-)